MVATRPVSSSEYNERRSLDAVAALPTDGERGISFLDVDRSAATTTMAARIASLEMLSDTELLPHLICSPPVGGGGDVDEAGQHGSAR
jgi:hypothetical protein